MRILHLGKFFPPDLGGMETYLAGLMAAQQTQGGEPLALVHGQPRPDDPPGLKRVPVQARLLYTPIALGYPWALARALRDDRPEALHLHLPNPSVFWALLLPAARRLPWIVHWHSDVELEGASPALAWAYRLIRPFEQAVLARAETILATSPPYLKASPALRDHLDRAQVVPLGLPPPPPGGRPAPAWTPGRLRVLAIGRLTPYKGFHHLIEAVAGLPDVELRLIGDGELRAALQAQVAALGPAADRVHLMGALDEADKHAWLASCELLALPSTARSEAFGLVLLEAMAHGKPCLASDVPGSGMPWLLRVSGGGRVLPPHDVPAWQAALRALASDPAGRAALGAAGQRAWRQHFTMEASAAAVTRACRRVLGPPAPPPAGLPARCLVVIPARNEAATLPRLLGSLKAAGFHEVLVIDDRSTDGTGELARAAGVRVLRPTLGLGAWGGMQTGLRHALRAGHDAVITMDADGQHEVADLPALLRASAGAEVVIGAFPARASRLRRLAWAWFRLLTGLPLTDLTSGFRCYRGGALAVLASPEATLLDYQDVGTLLMLRRAGLHIVEVPVHMNPREVGGSRIFHSWFSVIRYMAVTTVLCLSRWRVSARRA